VHFDFNPMRSRAERRRIILHDRLGDADAVADVFGPLDDDGR
jgi:hypothetical protein